MKMADSIAIELTAYYSELREDLKVLLPAFCSDSKFEDDVWVCDKLKKSPAASLGKYTIRFNTLPVRYREAMKYYVLNDQKIQVSTAQTRISWLHRFTLFLEENCSGLPLNKVTKATKRSFKSYMMDIPGAKSWKENVWSVSNLIFDVMHGWPEFPESSPNLRERNPWTRTKKDKRNNDKYIPEEVVQQLDSIFRNHNEIPLYYRACYWILRSIPSRPTEVCGMSWDCIKPYADHYTLILPTWKTNGGYLNSEPRIIHIREEEHGKFLLDLVREQKKEALRIQELVTEEQKEMLFIYQFIRFYKRRLELRSSNKTCMLKRDSLYAYLKEVCKRYNVKDKSGKSYMIAPHQFRHNGITDRLAEGFELEEIRDMTGHKGNTMITDSYTHISPEVLKAKSDDILAQRTGKPVNTAVYFQGRILNMTNHEIKEWLLKNPRRFRIRNGDRSIGLCSDITSCKGGIFECLACNYFVPNADDLEYFEEQVTYWEKLCDIFKNKPIQLENFKYNLALHRAIINRIKSVISGEIPSEKRA